MIQAALDLDGFCSGPLFAPVVKRRAPKPHNGPERVKQVRSREPLWVDRYAMNAIRKYRAWLTVESGVPYSIDHIVPINHPLVCGLHVQNNLCVIPLLDNIRKSNNWWPDMWAPQGEIF